MTPEIDKLIRAFAVKHGITMKEVGPGGELEPVALTYPLSQVLAAKLDEEGFRVDLHEEKTLVVIHNGNGFKTSGFPVRLIPEIHVWPSIAVNEAEEVISCRPVISLSSQTQSYPKPFPEKDNARMAWALRKFLNTVGEPCPAIIFTTALCRSMRESWSGLARFEKSS